jgi:hypothetical protein
MPHYGEKRENNDSNWWEITINLLLYFLLIFSSVVISVLFSYIHFPGKEKKKNILSF